MKSVILFLSIFILFTSQGCAQNSSQKIKGNSSDISVGGRCEDCKAIYDSPVSLDLLPSSVNLPDYDEKGQKIQLSGVVYKADGKTPASDVVIYVYHTDQEGNYSNKNKAKDYASKHGYIRGWVKTDKEGRYSFSTLRPASYPNSRNPQHIHVIIKEPGKSEYWIDEYVFDDDPYHKEESRGAPRGGSGIMSLKEKDGVWIANRDITLGLNVPDYPKAMKVKSTEFLAQL